VTACPGTAPPPEAKPFTVVETGIPEIRAALESGRVTSRQLVSQYLARIATYEDRINAIITVNPRALEEADGLDRERAAPRHAMTILCPVRPEPGAGRAAPVWPGAQRLS
jgi:hypothetical protein